MTYYSFFSDSKLNDLLTKLLNTPDKITTSEKLILIGNLSEKLNKETGTIVNSINTLITRDREIYTALAPSTLNNLLSDVYMFLSSNFNRTETLKEKYNYIDITTEINKRSIENRDKMLNYKVSITRNIGDSNFLNGKNDELVKLIEGLDLDLIIKIYIVVIGIL